MKRFLAFILLAGALCAQTIPPGAGVYSLNASSGSGSGGTVTSVSWTGGIVSVATPTTTPAFTLAGTSGGIPYFSSTSTWASSGLLTATALMTGGGAGAAPSTPSATSTLDASGNMTLASSLTINGATGGAVSFGQGPLPSLATTSVTLTAPTSVTSYTRTLPGVVGSTGMVLETVSGTNQTESVVTALPNGFTATTQSASDNSTKVATTAYTDAAVAAGGWHNNASNVQTQTALGTTSVSGYTLTNTTAAAAGAQQVSPAFIWTGQGWRTNATAASEAVAFKSYILPVQGAADPTAQLMFDFSVNAGAFSNQLYFTSTGGITGNGTLTFTNGSVQIGGSGNLGFQGRCFVVSPADGNVEFQNQAGTGFTILTLGGHTSSFPGIKRNGTAVNIRLGDDSGDAGITSSTLAQSGKNTIYNNVTTAGWGHPAIYAAGRVTAQTAAAASFSTYTVGAADGSFLVSANVLVTASATHSFTVTCTYTDEGNTSRTLTMTFSSIAGVLATAIVNTGGAVPYEGVPLHIRCKASTAITFATTGTFTSVTYNAEGVVQQIL